MRKKRNGIFEPGIPLFFISLVLFAVLTIIYDYRVAIAQGLFVLLLFLYYRRISVKRRRDLSKYVQQINANFEAGAHNNICPLPMVIVRLDSSQLLWANDCFYNIVKQREHVFDINIEHIVPNFSLRWVLEGKKEYPGVVTLFNKKYMAYGGVVRSSGKGSASDLMAAIYWLDVTELEQLRLERALSSATVAIIMLDNYEECFNNLPETEKSTILAAVDEKINRWVLPAKGILRRYDRDRYLFIFEAQYLEKFIEGKFNVLESVRELTGAGGTHITLSVGIGKDGQDLHETLSFSQLSIDMALSRGGDQAVIKNRYNFEFYGGHSKEVEKRTKVKSRVMAATLKRLITDSSFVIVMGHRNSDADAMGAAIGLACATNKLGKKAFIVYNEETTLAKTIVTRLKESHNYKESFINSQQAMLFADRNTLLIVVDCNRPEIVESKELLQSIHKIAVIDHHRRASTYIDNAALNFHEPYASSTCELVCELLQYMCDPKDVSRPEAEALLAGIVLDTKNFTMHTGVRTFEAAAFARSAGADTVAIKRLFQTDFDVAKKSHEIVNAARIVEGNVAVSVISEPVDRVAAAQAADALLDITGVSASFVTFPSGNETIVSARSLGDINVQMICEKLGGGGHQTIAGAQIKNIAPHEANYQLLSAIKQYIEEQ